jgi:hypothetical protein
MYYWKKGKRLHLIDPSTLDKYNIITTKQPPIKLSQFSKKDQEKIKKAPKQVKYVPLPVGAAAENKVVKVPKTRAPKAPIDPNINSFIKEELKRGRKKALLKTHPDKGGTNEKVKAVYEAYAELPANPTPLDIVKAEESIFPLPLFGEHYAAMSESGVMTSDELVKALKRRPKPSKKKPQGRYFFSGTETPTGSNESMIKDLQALLDAEKERLEKSLKKSFEVANVPSPVEEAEADALAYITGLPKRRPAPSKKRPKVGPVELPVELGRFTGKVAASLKQPKYVKSSLANQVETSEVVKSLFGKPKVPKKEIKTKQQRHEERLNYNLEHAMSESQKYKKLIGELTTNTTPAKLLAVLPSDVKQLSRNERVSLMSEIRDSADSTDFLKVKQHLFPDELGLPEDLPSPVRTLDIRAKILKQKEEKEAKAEAKEERAKVKRAKNAEAKAVRDAAREQRLSAPPKEESEEEFEPKEKTVWKTKIQLLNNLGIKLSQYKANPELKQAVDAVMDSAHARDVERRLQFGNAEITEEEKEKRLADEQIIRQIMEAVPEPEPELEELDWANIGPEIEAEESDEEPEPEPPKVDLPKIESPASLPVDKPTRSPSQGRFGGNGLDFKHIKQGSLTENFNEYNNHFLHKINNLEEFAHLVVTHPKLFDKRVLKKSEFYLDVLSHHKNRK